MVRLEEIAGKGPDGHSPRKELFRQIMSSEFYKDLPQDLKRGLLNNEFRKTQDAAKQFLIQEDPSLQQQLKDKLEAMKAEYSQ